MINKIRNWLIGDLVDSVNRLEKAINLMMDNHLKHIHEEIAEIKQLIKNK